MPLHSIEVENFKSYKGTHTIGPFKHFTSVIGPNGAGKSNLMDAISFVLGVRSNQLRSTQLRDLVYKSGGLEKPGDRQANKASVAAIYIDAATGQEYRFCRTIIVSSEKSGSSSYTINRKSTKWEDYQTALEKHNILVKAKNFLVFQGDVEAIASQNPKTLCKLIDQISGSLELAPEYESKQAAYVSASKQSNEQIIRRRMITGEIKEFKQQKSEIEKYERLCSERDQAMIHHLVWKLYHIEQQISQRSESIVEKKSTLDSLRNQVAELEKLVATARREYTQLTKEVLKAERELKAQEKDKEDNKLPKLVECEERIKHLVKKQASENKAMSSLLNEKATKEKDLIRLQEELRIVVEARTQFYRKQAAINPSMALSQDKLKEYQEIKRQSLTHCPAERALIKNITQDLKTKTDKLAQIDDHLDEVRDRSKKLDQEHDAQTNKKTICEYKIDSLVRELGKARKQLQDAQTQRTRQIQTETELKEKLQDCLKKINEAGAAQRETDAEQRMRTMIEKLQRLFPGVSGRLQDLCTPVARKHDIAIRIVLGRNMDAVVVDTQKTAIDCVEYLKNQRLGKANFIPLDTIHVAPINERLRNLTKGVRLAIDLTKYDPIYERAVQHACGNTIICDTLQLARNVVYERGNEVKAVTLDGTVIHKGGNISGGVSGLDSSRRFDEREVQGLKRAQEEILAMIKENQSKMPRNTDDALLAEIGRLENDLTLVKDDLLATETRLTSIIGELRALRQREQELSTQSQKIKSEVENMRTELTGAQEVVNKLEDNLFASFCRCIGVQDIREYEGHQLQLQEQRSTEQERLETTVSKLEHQINFEKEQLEGLSERQGIISAAQKKTQATLQSVEETQKQIEDEIQELDEEITRLEGHHQELVESQGEKSKAAAEAKSKLVKATRALDEALREISGCNDDIERLVAERLNIYRRCKLESVALPLKHGDLAQLPIDETVRTDVPTMEDADEASQQPLDSRDYGIEVDYTELEDEEKQNEDSELEQQMIDRLAQLTTKIEVMMPKNRAIQKLEELEARFRSQEEAFEAARKLAKTTRDEFNEVKERRARLFNKAFQHVSQRISEVYRELYGVAGSTTGGSAYLTLEDPEEPYLYGLRYDTMPPGQRYRDMEQLSGGEKTMAALALLFAIHSYQPSPFFVLDEVDAALDNTNVARIAGYIRSKAGEKFQFVVISLKSNFYDKANGLVGIYRDNEWGGTKSLTLDLDQYEY